MHNCTDSMVVFSKPITDSESLSKFHINVPLLPVKDDVVDDE